MDRVVRALAPWPRLSHLLAYMGERLSSGDADQLNGRGTFGFVRRLFSVKYIYALARTRLNFTTLCLVCRICLICTYPPV